MQYSISDLKLRIESTYTTTPTSKPTTTTTSVPETVREGNVNGHTKTTRNIVTDTESDLDQERDSATDLVVIDKDHDVESDRYIKIVSWSDSDNCYIGLCPEVTSVECRGNNEKEVFESLCNIVEETVALHRLLGKRLPGSRQLIAGDVTSTRSVYIPASSTSTDSRTDTKQPPAISQHTQCQPVSEDQSDTGTPYRFRSTLMSRQNRFLRECSTRVRMS